MLGIGATGDVRSEDALDASIEISEDRRGLDVRHPRDRGDAIQFCDTAMFFERGQVERSVFSVQPDEIEIEPSKNFDDVRRGEAEREAGGDPAVGDGLFDPVGAWHETVSEIKGRP